MTREELEAIQMENDVFANESREVLYWAAKTDESELLGELHSRVECYYDYLQTSGLYHVWLRSYKAYYGGAIGKNSLKGALFDNASMQRDGRSGEIDVLVQNHYLAIASALLSLSSGEKMAYQCVASNADVDAMSSCIVGNNVVDYYANDKNLNSLYREDLENALIFGLGEISLTWNTDLGKDVDEDDEYGGGDDEDNGVIMRQGDIDPESHTPLDVVRDVTLRRTGRGSHSWKMIRTFANKYDLIVKYPEHKAALLEENEKKSYEGYDSFLIELEAVRGKSDQIPVFTFFHKDCPALEGGRIVIFTASRVLYSGPNIYETIPIFEVVPLPLKGTCFGYSPLWGLLSNQEMLNRCNSIIASNISSYGLEGIYSKDPNLKISKIGQKTLYTGAEKPEPINLVNTSPEIYNYRRELISDMGAQLSVNDVIRGNPGANIQSGNYAALMVAQGIQANTRLQESYENHCAEATTEVVMQLQRFARSPRLIQLAGKQNRPIISKFSGADLQGINKVTVQRISPLARTIGGRMELMRMAQEQGHQITIGEWYNFMSTGRLESTSLDEEQQGELALDLENEKLADHEEVLVLVTEHHRKHITKHLKLLNTPQAKEDPELSAKVLAHVQDHIDKWSWLSANNPQLLMLTGQEPIPMAGPPGMAAGSPPTQGGAMAPGPFMGPPDAPGMPAAEQMGTNLPNLPAGSPEGSQAAYETFTNSAQQPGVFQ